MPRILIAEDDPAIRALLQRILAEAGYDVETATDGHMAVEMVTQVLPDLLITDLLMPGLTGWSVLARVRRHTPQLPILVISGAGTGVPHDTTALPTHTHFLRKPLLLQQVLAAVEDLLNPTRSTPPPSHRF